MNARMQPLRIKAKGDKPGATSSCAGSAAGALSQRTPSDGGMQYTYNENCGTTNPGNNLPNNLPQVMH